MNKQTKGNILVTGATGFIGSHLTNKLVTLGFRPYVLVRNKNDIGEILNSIRDKINIFETDIANFKNLRKIVTKINPQTVFHLAAFGVYTYSDINFGNVKAILDSNIMGTVNLFHSLKDSDCKLFINTGSCFEYGSSLKPFKEKDTLAPVNIYGSSKVASTLIAHQLAKSFGIKICTLRPFTVFGPGGSLKRFIPTVINNCVNNMDIKIPKTNIVRDFIYIEDVVRGYLAVLNKDDLRNDLVINLSTGIGKNLEEVALIVKRLADSESKIKKGHFPERFGEVLSLIGSNKTAKTYLNWQPQYSLEEGLKKLLQFIQRDDKN